MRALLRGGPGHASEMPIDENSDRIEIDVFEVNGQRVSVRAVYRFVGAVPGDEVLEVVPNPDPVRIFVFSGTEPLAGHGRGEL